MHIYPALFGNVEVIITIQPRMAINARAFIEPALILTGIGPDDDDVFFIEPDKISDIIGGSAITAEMTAEITVIDPYFTVPEDPIKLDDKTLPGIGSIHGKCLAVPANTVLREEAAHRTVSVRIEVAIGYVNEGERNGPVVRELNGGPAPVIEIHPYTGIGGLARLSENVGDAIIKIPMGI
jgi:hypothetical protein